MYMTILHRCCFVLLFGGVFLGPLLVNPASAQKKGGSSVRKQQEELEHLREEIKRYEKRIKEGERRERSTLQRIDDYDRQTSLIRSLLSRLTEEIAENRKEIAISQLNLATAEKELRRLKREYARMIVSMYKRGRTHDTELLLSSKSINEMFIRSKYLKAYSERQRQNAEEIRQRKRKIELQKMLLEEKLREQQFAIQEKRIEESQLKQKVDEHKRLLTRVRHDVQSYESQLKRKQAAARKVERLIADLIERERQRIEAERKRTAAKEGKAEPAPLPSKAISNTAFGRLRGRLPWPVSQGSVVGFFGEHTNPRWGTVTISNGIDIAVPNGSAVRSIADGTVSVRSFIAGYGNLVIINHDDNFLTVYAHLSEISVQERQKIKAGQQIGKSGEGISGPVLHFELWYEKIKQNPLHWLAKR
ncbi:MAG: peptidoglycan DD-metalloendopeptidase family protein [Bacteroidetes bacterium]|nr:peptidoglycan DD-metalloendopeptidase family protein [Bacteroidota bacterium]